MNGRRTGWLLLLAGLALASHWLVRGDGGETATETAGTTGYYLLDGTLRGVADDGGALFAISAARVQQRPSLARVDLHDVDVTWADRQALPWRLTARAGHIGDEWRQLELEGNVRLEGLDPTGEAIIFETDQLTILLAEKRAMTHATVRVAGADGVLLARGMVADLLRQRFTLETQVRGRFRYGPRVGEVMP